MELVIICIIYIILSAFGIYGTTAFDEYPKRTSIILSVVLGWILFPCIIMLVFGKFIANVNDRY